MTRQVEKEYLINDEQDLEKEEQFLLQIREKHYRDN